MGTSSGNTLAKHPLMEMEGSQPSPIRCFLRTAPLPNCGVAFCLEHPITWEQCVNEESVLMHYFEVVTGMEYALTPSLSKASVQDVATRRLLSYILLGGEHMFNSAEIAFG